MAENLRQGYAGEILAEDDSFRLISLQPGEDTSPLILRLINTRLQETQPYEAVSYVWGDASQLVPVRVVVDKSGEESDMDITLSCNAALRRLRNKESARTLWIDSICINQSLTTEKNHQLALMGRIYQEATRVAVYLGKGTDDTDAAMKYIREIDRPSDYGDCAPTETSIQPERDEVTALKILFQRPWFHRVWVLQEITFAKKATVVCGNQELDWQGLLTFYHWNISSKLVEQLPYSVNILRDTRHCGATDPRDKLYAILPLLNRDHDELVSEIDASMSQYEYNDDETRELQLRQQKVEVRVDYGRSEQAVFIDLAISLLQTVGLDTLRQVVKQASISGLPSWVPDWSTSRSNWSSRNPPRQVVYRAGYTEEPEYMLGWTKSSPDSLQTWNVSEYSSVKGDVLTQIELEVVLVGKIQKLGDVCDIDNNFFPLRQWESLVPSKRYLEDRNRPDDVAFEDTRDWDNGPMMLSPFARAITGDDVIYPRAVKDAITFIKLYNNEATGNDKEGQRTNPYWNEKYESDDRLPLGKIFAKGASYEKQVQRLLLNCDGKRFFTTDTGFIGLCPDRAEVGDVVHVVKGASIPFVFRGAPSIGRGRADLILGSDAQGEVGNQHFELVGESFVLGVMAGDIWHDVADGTKTIEKIVVR
ncbi:heterokaryon incompatibility protein-domain-containing protein [Dactylonectria estremocensis]|uniref:Heterokaryon incompatibility protein-domain-containing protein n=1 Tax=Dactylonectria estremocensis TaxID=1079267 RepID=A0A9P9ES34_9HYPO|nr:heterokaryon incompatibility protein-domain-containing protein [Dactylonectria estremocensis]